MTSRNVYGVSVDSRSRNDNEPDNSYTVHLARTIDRVKTIQLGSFQFQDTRYAFDRNAEMNYSEPITIPANTYLSFRETVSTLTKATNIRVDETRDISLLLPPTINPITNMVGDVVTTQFDTGLLFGVQYYPEANLTMCVVGADFPEDLAAFTTPTFPTNAGPLLTQQTTVAPYIDSGNPASFAYETNYLDELMGGVGNKVLRHRSAGAYTSYISAPKPTLVELLIMLNVATSDLTRRTDITDSVTGATNAAPIVITTASANGLVTGDQVVISGVTGNTAANGTFAIVALTTSTFELVGSSGNGAYVAGGTMFSPQQLNVPATFGFDNETNHIACFAPTRIHDGPLAVVTRRLTLIGSLADLLGFGNANLDPMARVSPPLSIKRSVQPNEGTFTSDEIISRLPDRLNPGNFISTTGQRRFYYTLPNGTPVDFVIHYGKYTPEQLADYMTAVMNVQPGLITVTYSAVTRMFTFTQTLGLPFALRWGEASPLVRRRFGFDALTLSGSSTYTSRIPAVFGIDVTSDCPDNTYAMTADETTKHFTFSTQSPEPLYTVSGTSTSNVGASWTPLADEALPFANKFKPGDVLTAVRPTLGSTQNGSTNITAATNATPIQITTALAHGLNTGDNVTIQFVEGNTAANGTWFITTAGPGTTTFTLDGSTGNGAYTSGGDWWTNASLVGGTQKSSATYTVVVQSQWDASTATPLLTLEPTASIFSAQDIAVNQVSLGTPSDDARILLKCGRRNVFMLHMEHPEGSPDTFGFPPVAWPPSEKAILSPSTLGSKVLRTLPDYNPATLSIPVSSSYTSPLSWNLLPPDYIVIVLKVTCASSDIHTHSYRGTSFPIFAKMLLTFPYVNVSEEMLFTTFPGLARLTEFKIEFQNPDGTLVDFNGRPHTYSLLFTVEEDTAVLRCY